MHILLASLLQSTTTTTVAKSTSTSGSLTPFLVLILIFGGAYLLFIRPRSKRARAQQAAARQVGVGDAVMTAGGIFGTVVEVTPDSVAVEVSPGVVMTFIPRAVSARPASAGSPPPPVGAGVPAYEEPAYEEPAYDEADEDDSDFEGSDEEELDGEEAGSYGDETADETRDGLSGDHRSEGTDPPEHPGSPRK